MCFENGTLRNPTKGLVTDLVIFNLSQAMRMTPELAPHSLSFHNTPMWGFCVKKDLTYIIRSIRQIFSGTGAQTKMTLQPPPSDHV
ncbi:hypothetical protein TNCV_766991 [Trichonephila clavipes]|nr:hypothetical protein TNCV_766991 [Trichonephila clavipes]